MIRFRFFYWAALFIVVLAGCSSVRVSQDYDPDAAAIRMGTFAWRDAVQPTTGDIRIDNSLLDRRIRTAVETHLTSRGGRRARTQPDYLLAYHLNIESRLQGDADYPFFGTGWYHYPWHGGFGRDIRVYEYDECILTIDVLNPTDGRLLWRGTGVYRLKTYATPQAAAAAMQKTVDRILDQYPPGQHLR